MLRISKFLLINLFLIMNLHAQNQSAHVFRTAETIHLSYPVNAEDVRAIGMGNTQIANGKTFNAMMYNPALLGQKRFSVEFVGVQASMPPSTYDAANYLSQHVSEFEEAISLNQIYDGLDALTASGATNQEKLDALHEIQSGLQFINDLFIEVTGPADDPKLHGIRLLPGISAQVGNFGFSLYGFGQAGFKVLLSPTFESLLEVDLPTTLDHPVQTAKAVLQLTAALAPAVIGPRKFSDQAFPVAFYSSYMDVVGTVGYGRPITKNLAIGANLKIINRRFLIDKIAVSDYETIISETWKKLKSDVTGLTCDLGAQYQFKWGTSVGAVFQNIIPVKEITKSIDTDFQFHTIDWETKSDSTWQTTVTRPFKLDVPFIMSIGICHPIRPNWDISFDWYDIAGNDTRYEETTERIRLGIEYRFQAVNNVLTVTPRVGMADKKATFGLGLNIFRFLRIDGAYAYDTFVNENAYFVQVKFGW
ncbi:hypothetical protein JW960_19470 [candidate division KSB1 bacterium]|nr:hypothetical protein [candidate division KSB1 bacterium]